MRILVTLLLDTLPMLGNVLLLCFFVFFIFGIVGVQLWAGLLRNRCFLDDNAKMWVNALRMHSRQCSITQHSVTAPSHRRTQTHTAGTFVSLPCKTSQCPLDTNLLGHSVTMVFSIPASDISVGTCSRTPRNHWWLYLWGFGAEVLIRLCNLSVLKQ